MADNDDLELPDLGSEAKNAELSGHLQSRTATDLEAVFDVPVNVSAVLGKANMQVSDMLNLAKGTVIELDFLQRQVLTSRNISGRWPTNFLLGGLNYQVEHHLFPSMPRPNLKKIQPVIRDFCADHGIRYTEQSLASAYRDIVRYLNKVGVTKPDPFGCPLAAYLRAPA